MKQNFIVTIYFAKYISTLLRVNFYKNTFLLISSFQHLNIFNVSHNYLFKTLKLSNHKIVTTIFVKMKTYHYTDLVEKS